MSQKVARKGAAKAEKSASIEAIDTLRQRIAAEAELIEQETMPNKANVTCEMQPFNSDETLSRPNKVNVTF
jgi:hypothetical protein